jgi:small subunit ribosomal protein S6
MSKTKATGSSRYEILFIVPNKYTEGEAKTVIGNVEKIISDNGGQIVTNEYWGKKKLAYEIKHNAYGYYQLFEFDLEAKNLSRVDNLLNLSHEVLRHQVIKIKVKTPEEIAKAKSVREKIEAKEEEAKKEAAPKNAKKMAPNAPKEENKAELKDLDQKLEGILNANDLI